MELDQAAAAGGQKLQKIIFMVFVGLAIMVPVIILVAKNKKLKSELDACQKAAKPAEKKEEPKS